MQPMRLLRIPQPFDHPDFIYELKLDGFRGVAVADGRRCRLYSRNGHEFRHWPTLCAAIARALHGRTAVLDGEIVCLDTDGRSNFYSLIFRRRKPFFYAFDAVTLDGVSLDHRPLLDRKALLRDICNDEPRVTRQVWARHG
jgi:bifunctional non-homologous end joining protein LigD